MMKKRNYWPLLFIGIFTFTLGMIIWTIMSAVKTPVHEDNTFLISYQNIDSDFHNIEKANREFSKKYDFKLIVNGREFGLTTEDIFYSQRVIEKKSTHKDLLKKGNNEITFAVYNKSGALIDSKIKLLITRATNNKFDIELENDKAFHRATINLALEGNWNLTGNVELNDGSKGYFLIKTNAI